MTNPLDFLGKILGGRSDENSGLGPGYTWEHWAGDPQWQQRIRRMQNMQGMMNQQAQAQAALMRQYTQQRQHQHYNMDPALDPEWHTTQVLTLLFGEHWELINAEIKRLAAEG